MTARPLEGIRVLDAGTRLAAPFCAGLLGELGADVIKIEQPGAGDMMRSLGPFVETDAEESGSPYSLFWAVEGRGRRSVTLDLRRPEGQEIFRSLASVSDVICENFRPGTLERWHIAPGDLDPRLVVVRISVFGQDGPYRERGGLDRLGIAYGGLLNLTGFIDSAPVRPGLNVADYLTGVFCAQAAIAALYERDVKGTGRGEVVDASLYGAILRINEWTVSAYDQLGLIRQRNGNRLANSAPIDNYLAADDRYVCIVAGSDANFRRLCHAMGRTDLLDDPRYASASLRADNGDDINGVVASWVGELRADEIEKRCIDAGVPAAPILDVAGIFSDPHIRERGDLAVIDDPVAGPVRQQAPYPRLGSAPRTPPTGAPRLGEHTRTVLSDLCGLGEAELDRLTAEGTI
jgi:crotonobetainyl-CoA:carnitine CoA-transferase CaiB-like acyl-CoA transferase